MTTVVSGLEWSSIWKTVVARFRRMIRRMAQTGSSQRNIRSISAPMRSRDTFASRALRTEASAAASLSSSSMVNCGCEGERNE